MKKQLSLALAAVLSLSVAGVSLAAPANPFVDVPANHWAYDALQQLQKDGVVDGYGDGAFRGDRNLTRYEMAAMIAKITVPGSDKNAPLLRKLQSEFAAELYNLGVRVDALEKNASTIKFTGEGRIRYQRGMAISDEAARFSGERNSSSFQERILLHMEADVNDKVKFYGRVNAENFSNHSTDNSNPDKASETGSLFFERAEFNWTNKNFNVSMGRLVPTLGQGLIWDDSSADGFLVSYDFGRAKLSGGYLDLDANHGFGTSVNAAVANLDINVTDNINLSIAHLRTINSHNLAQTHPIDFPDGYAFKQTALGGNVKLGGDFTVIGEYVYNNGAPAGAQKKGAWGRLQWKEADSEEPGTFSVFVDYLKLGNWAVDSTGYAHALNVAGGNGIGGDGAKGFGVGLEYAPAKNILIELNGYRLKTYDGSQKYKPSYNFATNFYF